MALLSASAGPVQAASVNTTPAAVVDIYELVRDGMTSSDGGDRTVSKQDIATSALTALRAAAGSWEIATSTGKRDLAADSSKGVPSVPLGAARGTIPIEDFASPVAGREQWDELRKAKAAGQERIAALVGSVGVASMVGDKPGNTVFVSPGSAVAFNDGGGSQGSSTSYAFAPGSTSTATITIAGAGNLSRQRGDGESYFIAANSLQAASPVIQEASRAPSPSDTAQATLGYNYVPAAAAAANFATSVNATTRGNAVAASFSDAMTVTAPNRVQPSLAQRQLANGKIEISEVQPPTTSASVQTSQVQRQPAKGAVQTSQVQRQPGNNTVQTSQMQRQPGNDTVQTSQMQRQPGTDTVQTSQMQRRPVIDTMQTSQVQRQPAKGTVQTSQVQATPGPSTPVLTVDARDYDKLINLMRRQPSSYGAAQDDSQMLISTSVSANPTMTAARYMADAVNATRSAATTQSVEAFEVGAPPGAKTRIMTSTTVSDPLQGKVMASAGALNNSLALP
jgi:hypothetical protein